MLKFRSQYPLVEELQGGITTCGGYICSMKGFYALPIL